MQIKASLLALVGILSSLAQAEAEHTGVTSIVYYSDQKCVNDASGEQISPAGVCHPLMFPSKSLNIINAPKGYVVSGYESSDCSGDAEISVLPNASPKFCGAVRRPLNSVKLVKK